MQSVRALLVGVDGETASHLETAGARIEPVETAAAAIDRFADTESLAPGELDVVVVSIAELAAAPIEDVDATSAEDSGAAPTGSGDDALADSADAAPGDRSGVSPAPSADSDDVDAERVASCVRAVVDAAHEFDRWLPVVAIGAVPAVAGRLIDADLAGYVPDGGDADETLAIAIEDAVAAARDHLDRSRVPRDAPDPGCVLREGRIARAGDGFPERFGVDSADGEAFVDLLAPEDGERIEQWLRSLDGAAETIDATPATDATQTLRIRARRSERDGAVVATVRDVTERAAEVARAAESASMLDSLLEDIPMSIYFKDRRGRHVRVSDHITRADPQDYIENDEGKIHPHADDILGKTDHDLYDPVFAAETFADDLRVIEDEERIVGAIESGTTSLGEPLYISTTKVPRYEDGEAVGLVGVTMDVTERVIHREELERQNERLNEFAEVLTHDLRNPLSIASGYLEVLEEGYDETAVEAAEGALDRMEALVDEIRAFILEGRLVEDSSAVDLETVAAEAWSTVDTGDAVLAVEGELVLTADRSRLRRLLENLYRNAVEHGTPAGDGDGLTVRVVAGDHEFAVEDDGVGIDSGEADDVLARGYSTSEDGTGFGLAIVESIAEAHGWTVSVGESDDGGARFAFTDVVLARPAD